MSEPAANPLGIEGLEDATEIGVGGFSTVYKAFQPAFRRTVAVKVLAALNLDDAARDRFERECQAMGSLSEHPNIVTVYGAGFTATGRPYLVMAHLPGGSMAERLAAGGPIPWPDATEIGVHLAGALETAHRADIIHRDIKPGNVLMSAYGDAQLTDFGIARISGGHETRSGVITASMSHAPPEVLDGQRPSVAADVYSLGSTLYELLTGAPAFQVEGDESMVPMLRRILTEPPPDLRPRGVPDAVCRVIEQSMAKDPSDRQPSALELGRALQAARASLGLQPGKLTVPADAAVDEAATAGETISFVAAAPAPLTDPPAAAVPVVPPAAEPVPPGIAAAPAPPADAPAAASPPSPPVTPLAPVDPAPAPPGPPPAPPGGPVSSPTVVLPGQAGAGPPASSPSIPPPAAGSSPPAPVGVTTDEPTVFAHREVAAGVAPPGGVVGIPPGSPPVAGIAPPAPSSPPASRSRLGLLVGVGVFVVLALVAGIAFAVTRSSEEVASTSTSTTASTSTSSSTTTSTASTSTSTSASTTTEAPGYSRVLERQFVRDCTQGGTVTAQFCQCVYEQFRDTVPFERFRELDDRARQGAQVGDDPTFRQITQDCRAKLGPAATPPSTVAGAPPPTPT